MQQERTNNLDKRTYPAAGWQVILKLLLSEVLVTISLVTLFLGNAHVAGWQRFVLLSGGLAVVQTWCVLWLARRIGAEHSTHADWLTIVRLMAGNVLAGLVAMGVEPQDHDLVMIGFVAAVFGATICDWLDGPLARKYGPTRLGGVLDIEADSWITLWAAGGAVAWGGLPQWCLIPPLLHYLHPLFALRSGQLPRGGGPPWSRATGVAQMILFITALMPISGVWKNEILIDTAIPVTTACAVVMLVTLRDAQSAQQAELPPRETIPNGLG